MIGCVSYLRAFVPAVLAVAAGAVTFAVPAPAHAAGVRPVVIAHRNGGADAPENTLAAARHAFRQRAGWLETDVQRTRDGKLILMHDSTLGRTTNAEHVYPDLKPWRVRDLTLRQIKRLDAGSWFAHRFRGTRVPTLKEYLHLLDRTGQGALLEIKDPQLYPGLAGQMARALKRYGWLDAAHHGRLIVQSFSASAVRRFHRDEPYVHTALIGEPTGRALRAAAKYTDAICPKYTHVTRGYVRAAHRLHGVHGLPLKVMAWTIDTRHRAHTMAGDGVDAIVTDHPDLLR